MEQIPSAEASVEEIVNIMHGVAQSHVPRSAFIGIVVEPPSNFIIKANNIELTPENAYISKRLLVGYERAARGHLVSATQNKSGGSGDSAYESHNHDIDNDYTESFIYTDTLKVGDWVSILPCEGAEGQLYIINEEVVKLE